MALPSRLAGAAAFSKVDAAAASAAGAAGAAAWAAARVFSVQASQAAGTGVQVSFKFGGRVSESATGTLTPAGRPALDSGPAATAVKAARGMAGRYAAAVQVPGH